MQVAESSFSTVILVDDFLRREFGRLLHAGQIVFTTRAREVFLISGTHSKNVIELAAYLANSAGSVPLVLDLHIAHDRFGSSSDPSLNGHLHYPNDIDKARVTENIYIDGCWYKLQKTYI